MVGCGGAAGGGKPWGDFVCVRANNVLGRSFIGQGWAILVGLRAVFQISQQLKSYTSRLWEENGGA